MYIIFNVYIGRLIFYLCIFLIFNVYIAVIIFNTNSKQYYKMNIYKQ